MNASALLRHRLDALSPLVFELEDQSEQHRGHAGAASGGHYSLLIVSKSFEDKPRLERQRAVMALVGDLIPTPVHALSVRAVSPQEFNFF